MMPTTDLESVVTRLEKENRNLLTRLEKLEKKQGFSVAVFVANVVLLLCAGLLGGYLGLYPRNFNQLPLRARSVETEELIVRSPNGPGFARVVVDAKGYRVLDEQNKPISSSGP